MAFLGCPARAAEVMENHRHEYHIDCSTLQRHRLPGSTHKSHSLSSLFSRFRKHFVGGIDGDNPRVEVCGQRRGIPPGAAPEIEDVIDVIRRDR
jgi:hypothetical protein